MKRNVLLIIALAAFTFSILVTAPRRVGAMTYDPVCLSNASTVCKVAGAVAAAAADAMGLSGADAFYNQYTSCMNASAPDCLVKMIPRRTDETYWSSLYASAGPGRFNSVRSLTQ